MNAGANIIATVVIATRNRRPLLEEAVATVLGQTGERDTLELIVVDDASADDTWEFLCRLARAGPGDTEVRIFRQDKHEERSAARNRGLREARGEFIMFLDDDDLLRPDTLARLTAALRQHREAVVATGPCRVLEVGGNSVKVYWPAGYHLRKVWPELLFGWWANSGQNLYRTAVVRECGGFDPKLVACEDRKLWLNVARRGPVSVIPGVTMTYRQHEGQSKPPDLDSIRRGVWREFMETLPAAERRKALRTRAAAELSEEALAARKHCQFGPALWLQVRACLTAPWLVISPLTGRPVWWSLKKCLLRSSAP